MRTERVYALIFASVYPHYVEKASRHGRTRAELDEVIRWLTGYATASGIRRMDDMVDAMA
ncbi:MAG TPA: DUF2200 family protein [Pyrinomonadaceae bacterium]|nr:DUF2200 family protein [Chloracidobacterium sp.]MBP9936714.1 DUF2200 family protein [Pyrinomonadaceae bacterium]MBK9439398.1 DUF2200 family protein [Chloracidobacterium sp.]MBK9768239.1 DUF2200 family protein [Chloracidobacterium sp.]MBL0239315.1 DUF2200 family protein [Chloracidobacterium sp.]